MVSYTYILCVCHMAVDILGISLQKVWCSFFDSLNLPSFSGDVIKADSTFSRFFQRLKSAQGRLSSVVMFRNKVFSPSASSKKLL